MKNSSKAILHILSGVTIFFISCLGLKKGAQIIEEKMKESADKE